MHNLFNTFRDYR